MNLQQLGWNDHWQHEWNQLHEEPLQPARVARAHGRHYLLLSEYGDVPAELAGRLRHEADSSADLPAVGDWVGAAIRPDEQSATIVRVLPRRSCFSRNSSGSATQQQIIAANIDVVFLVAGLDGDFNPRRIERYLAAAWTSGATPVIVLNKADLADDLPSRIDAVMCVAPGVAVHAVSAASGEGFDQLAPYASPGRTVALLGSSGVGKSSIINCLLGRERQQTAAVREHDSRGRHTTTSRELILLEAGGLLIDTPGMRELQVWSEAESPAGFSDIDQLAAGCRYRDCGHCSEPGCAVRAAIESGELEPDRLDSFFKLQREMRYHELRQDEAAASVERKKWKAIHKAIRHHPKYR